MAKRRTSPDDLIGTAEAGRVLGVQAQRVAQLIRAGRLPARLIGGSFVIRRGDLALVADRRVGRPRAKPTPK